MKPRRRLIPILRQWWYRLCFEIVGAPKNEFDISLSLDADYYSDLVAQMSYWTKKLKDYEHDLCVRRDAAHEDDMERSEVKK
jgi:hypothetical protein